MSPSPFPLWSRSPAQDHAGRRLGAVSVLVSLLLALGSTSAAQAREAVPGRQGGTAPAASDRAATASPGPRDLPPRAESRAVPRVLIRRDFRRATPTRWCKRHRPRCLRILAGRYTRAFRHGRIGRTHWTRRAVRRIRPVYTSTYRRVCADRSPHVRSIGTEDRYRCPLTKRSPESKARAQQASRAWTRYRRGADCSLRWIAFAGQPGYHMICAHHPPRHGVTMGSPGKKLIACEASALAASAYVGVFSAGPGAAVTFGSLSTGCGIHWAFSHFLNW